MNTDNLQKTKKVTPGLGKGLGALIPNLQFSKDSGFKISSVSESEETKEGNLIFLDPEKVKKNPYQPRTHFDPAALEDLKNSIREHGVFQPITVRHSINGYELISGERRLRASRELGLKSIPAYILDVVTDEQMLELAIIENVQRENLNPIEIANGYQRLIDECKYTQEKVAERVGKERSTVTNFLRLLRLPEFLQEQLRIKKISMGHARAMLGLTDHVRMIAVGKEVLEKNLSVRATESLIRDIDSGKMKFSPDGKQLTKVKDKREVVSLDTALELEEIETRLRHKFGTNVKIHPKNQKSGTIEMEFYSIDDFERLLDMLETKE